MEEEIKKALEELDARITKLESAMTLDENKGKLSKASYSGLAGGLRLLIDNGFFDQPKTIDEIIAELNREGYYNTHAGVASTLSMTFVKKQKTLTRMKEGSKWAYVKRK